MSKLQFYKFDSEEEAREFINKDKLEVVSIYPYDFFDGSKIVVWYYE